jgi:hypothetical protein
MPVTYPEYGYAPYFVPRMPDGPNTVSARFSRPVSTRLKMATEVMGFVTLAMRNKLDAKGKYSSTSENCPS